MRKQFKALDLFSGAGGATKGLQLAGFHVTGVDNRPQPRYCGDAFVRADALAPPFRLSDFDLVWASPPCQAFTTLRFMPNGKTHPNLIPPVRAMLRASGAAFVIENVPSAPIRPDAILCGTMFDLKTRDGSAELRRHRWFECSFPVGMTMPCQHGGPVIGIYGGHARDRRRTIPVYGGGDQGWDQRRRNGPRGTVGVYGHAGGSSVKEKAQRFLTADRKAVMGIDWMTNDELSQAIPPAYSEWIGTYARLALEAVA